jgi:hypothetical protein
VERQLASTTPACPAEPGIPANIHRYSFRSATQVGTGYTVLMDGAPTNNPRSQLTLSLTPTAGAFAAAATWTRTDQIAVLTWTVTGNLTLTVKP